MVLSMGHQVYFGDASGAEAWFASSLGYPRHHSTSAVDFIMDLVNVSFAKARACVCMYVGRVTRVGRCVWRLIGYLVLCYEPPGHQSPTITHLVP